MSLKRIGTPLRISLTVFLGAASIFCNPHAAMASSCPIVIREVDQFYQSPSLPSPEVMGFHEHLERSSIRHATAKQAFLFADGVVETPDALDFDLGKYNQEYTGAYGLLRHGILMDAWIRIVIDSDGTVTHCAHNKPMIHGIEPIMGWRTLKSKDILK